jgi:hypothetical protein
MTLYSVEKVAKIKIFAQVPKRKHLSQVLCVMLCHALFRNIKLQEDLLLRKYPELPKECNYTEDLLSLIRN